jgi:hypothetical protein
MRTRRGARPAWCASRVVRGRVSCASRNIVTRHTAGFAACLADVLPLEGGLFLRRDLLATRIALRRGRLAALLSQGRAAANAPLRRCASHPGSDEQSRASVGRVG